MSLLEIKDVTVSYPQSEKPALSQVSLSVSNGEYIALVGSNGSGKSTLARVAAGFIAPDHGNVELEDTVLPGIVFQQPKEQIVAGVVERDTAFGPQNLNMSKAEIELRTMECLSVTGLVDRASSRTFELSLGQTQRLALSGILALFPDLLILDEVTSMLDPSCREEILSLIDEWHHKGHAIIHVTHDKNEVLRAERVVMLDKGNVIFDGTPSVFKKNKTLMNTLFGTDEWYKKKSTATKKTSVQQASIQDESIEDSALSLCAEHISFSYPDFSAKKTERPRVFSAISFSLKKGTLTALTGPSGCGKSTLLECLAGLHSLAEGTIYASSRPVLALQESEAALFETFAADDVAFGPRNQGLSGKPLVARVKNAMELADLPYETYADRQSFLMSGGEKRKLSLAGIIALDSDIMLFDEPTAGLDPQSREIVMKTLRSLTQSGKTVLFSTHRREEAQFADGEITWQNLTGKAQCTEKNTLQKQSALQNSEMLLSLQRTGASFMAPPKIPQSPVNSMTPLFKYLVFFAVFISSLAVRPLWLCCALFFVCVIYALCAKYPIARPTVTFLKLLPWLLVFAVFQFLFYPAKQNEALLLQWGMFTISRSKIALVLCMIVRTASAVFSIGTFMFTTSEREILDGLTDFLKPLALLKIPVRYVVLVVGIIFRFIPLLLDEASGIIKTQLVRGGFGKARGFGKVKALLPLFVPLMLQAFRKAQLFADALTARYFN